jgi:hypothetical protein
VSDLPESSTPGCACDGPCPECPSGKPRKSCSLCEGTGKLCCEFPCWQRVGLTSEPCCPGCAPLDDPAPEPMATVTSLAGSPSGKETPEQDPHFRCVVCQDEGYVDVPDPRETPTYESGPYAVRKPCEACAGKETPE